MTHKILVAVLSALLLHAEDKVDLFAINRIKSEAFQNSKVMENAFYLTDVYGPRLTGSPGLQAGGRMGAPAHAGLGTFRRPDGKMVALRPWLVLHPI